MPGNDDDDSSFQLQKLLPPTDVSPSPDASAPSGYGDNLESPRSLDKDSVIDISKDEQLPDHSKGSSTQNTAEAADSENCYRWLLGGRVKNISRGGSSTDTSTSSSSSSSSSSSTSSFPSLPLPKPPDGGWGWMVVLGAFMVLVICDGLSYCFGVLYYELLVQFGESRSKTSLVGSIFFGVSMILGPLASSLTTRFGCRKMTIVGGLLSSVGFLLSYFANSLEMLFVTFGVIVGTGFSFCFITSCVIVHYYFDKRRSLATGLAVCGTGVGTFTFAPLMEYLISEYNWRGLFLVLSGISLNLVVCGMLFRPLRFTEEERLRHFCAEFDRLQHTREYLELRRVRNLSETTDVSTEFEVFDEEHRTMSMLILPTFASKKPTTSESSEILMEAMKNSNNPHLTFQRYMRNAYLRANNENNEDTSETTTTKRLVPNDKLTYSISLQSPLSEMESNTNTVSEDIPKVDISKGTTTLNHDESKTIPYQVIKNVPKAEKSHNKDVRLKPFGEDLRKSTSFIDLGNAMKSKSMSKVVTGYNMGKHNALGMQMLLYRNDIFFRRHMTPDPVIGTPCLLATSCPQFSESNEQAEAEWKGLSHAIKQVFTRCYKVMAGMTDFSLFRNSFFTLFVVSNFLFYIWSDIPYMYATDDAVARGIPSEKASFLISILGIFNTAGQLLFGFIGDMRINLINVYAIVLVVAGVSVAIIPLMTSYWSLALAYGMFGFFVSVTYPFPSVLLVNYLGLDQLTDAYGLLMLMQGLANVMGPPFAGWISDVTQAYDLTFYLSGVFTALSGVAMLVILIPGCRVEQVAQSYETDTETETDLEEKC